MAHLERRLLGVAAVGLGYWATARLGLMLAIAPGFASAIWPPSGVALAALLIGGRHLIPGVLIGSMAANLSVASVFDATSLLVAFSIAVGAALQAQAGAVLLRLRVGYPMPLESASDIGRFLLIAGPVSCLISASWGVGTLLSAGAIGPSDSLRTWGTWWCGDMLGALTVAPLILVMFGAPREAWRRRRLTVALPLCVAFALAVLAYVQVSIWERDRIQRGFMQLAEPLDDLLRVNLQGYLEVIEALRDFHVASRSIDPAEFQAFVEGPLRRHRGIAALSWLPLVSHQARRSFEAHLSASNGVPLEITERKAEGGLTRASDRREYMPVDYIQPLAPNRRAIGYDALSETYRRSAISSAVASNGAAATGPVLLARADDDYSLLVYIPIFSGGQVPSTAEARRAALLGCYAMVVRVRGLIEDSLAPSALAGLSLEIVDVTDANAPVVLLQAEALAKDTRTAGGRLRWEAPLTLAGRQWRIRAFSTSAYFENHGTSAPWGVLASGLLFTSLLGGFLLLVSGRSHRAEVLAASLEFKNRDLIEREADLRRAQTMARSGHMITRPDGSIESWSQTLELLLGRSAHDMPMSTREWLRLVHPDDRERFERSLLDAARSSDHSKVDYRLLRGDGEWVALLHLLEPLDPVAAVSGRSRWVSSIQDITDERQSAERIRRLNRVHEMLSSINGLVVRVRSREDLYREACKVAVDKGGFGMAWIGELDATTGDGVVVASHGGTAGYAEGIRFSAHAYGPEAERPACIAAREHRTVVCNDIEDDPSLAVLRNDLLARGHRAIASLPLQVNGVTVGVFTLFADEPNVFDAEELRLLEILASDVAFALDHLGKAAQIDALAYYDPLTGLANRHLLHNRMQHALAGATRSTEQVAIAFLDLDHFKTINDSLGHDVGDLLLTKIAQRLKGATRASDTVARLGGDEFVIMLPAQGRPEDTPERWISELLARILEVVSMPIELSGRDIRMSVSIGISVYPQDGTDPATLLRNADAAMYRSKELGRNRYQFFTADMHERVQARMELESDLKSALDRDEFELHYQPQIDLRSGRIVGLEALLRWRHPRHGLVGPGRFIALAEESGLIVPIGEWVMARAAMQNKAWQDAGLLSIPVAVNVSARQSAEGNLDDIAASVLRTTKLPAKYLELELTESLSMASPETMVPLMERLKEMGIELSIDDFGTGYSSMSYLKRFPIDKLKLDMSFVREITTDPDSLAISEAIIGMAHSLRLRVIAEGVETEGQLRLLASRGCDEIQGYFFSKPLPTQEITGLLAEDKRLSSDLLLREFHSAAVLVLDDDATLLARIRAVLAPHDFPLLTAETPEEAFEILACHEVGVVLCDQRMPTTRGTAFLGKVRQMYPQTCRILMSAYEDFEAARAAINVGAVYRFLDKSWEPEQLVALVNEALREHGRRKGPAELSSEH